MPRREDSASAGLIPVKGKFQDIRIGSLIQGYKGTLDDVWEILEMSNPAQYDHKTTPWFRAVSRATGEQVSIPPKTSIYPCTFMVPEDTVDPEVEKPVLDTTNLAPHQPLTDQDAVNLLVSELGGVVEAIRDHETGIITCPPYEEMIVPETEYAAHLRFAHGIDVSNVTDRAELVTLHGRSHADQFTKPRVGAAGFPHQHGYRQSVKVFGNLA